MISAVVRALCKPWVALFSLSLLALPRSARAEDIPVVNVTSAGPDRDVPARSFYLAGSASAKTTRVQAFLVRTSAPWLFGGGESTSCRTVGDKFDARFKRDKDPGAAALQKLASGEMGTETLLPGQGLELQAWVAPAWTRDGKDEGKETPFKIYVGPDEAFFLSGANYCVLVYKMETTKKVDTTSIAAAQKELNTSLLACDAKDAAEVEACRASAVGTFDGALDAATKGIDESSKKQLESAASASWTAFKAASDELRNARGILDSWAAGAVVKPGVPPPQYLELKQYSESAPQTGEEALGRAVTELLLRAGGQLFERTLPKAGKQYFVTRAPDPARDKTQPSEAIVTKAQFTADFAKLELITPTNEHLALRVGADALKLETADLTLLDLLELQRHRIRVSGTFVSIVDLRRQLASTALNQAQREQTVAATSAIGTLARYVNSALARRPVAAAAPAPPPAPPVGGVAPPAPTLPLGGVTIAPTVSPSVDAMLGLWLSGILASCEAGAAKWPGGRQCCSTADAASNKCTAAAWPLYSKQHSDGPLGDLAAALRLWAKADAEWANASKQFGIARENAESTPFTTPIGARFAFTQDNWFFSYVTPVVGYAAVHNRSEDFPIGYMAAQIHVIPNPVNTPLWSQGARDLLRSFALELGASLPAQKYGPGERYHGWKGLPPIFVGGTVHLLPYTGISVGGVLLERRSTSLENESAQAIFPLYVGLSVQANVPDVVRGLAKKTTTKTE